MTYAEMYLLDLDEFMQTYKRLQTRQDWNIENKCKKTRLFSYVAAVIAFTVGKSVTMSDEAILAKIDPYVTSEVRVQRGAWWRAGYFNKEEVEMMTPKGPIARYYKFLLGVRRFPLKHGALNWACGFVPAWLTFTSLNHWAQNRRLNRYLSQESTFGEMARELVRGKKADEATTSVMSRVEKEILGLH
eukprot:GGOE01036057.1.p1 GENE.GGOE01036057.1~~GGOE01036057.1.p1  ORF type:complete len:197 (-),score=38.74 GGOE01036057.1:253-816(-)